VEVIACLVVRDIIWVMTGAMMPGMMGATTGGMR